MADNVEPSGYRINNSPQIDKRYIHYNITTNASANTTIMTYEELVDKRKNYKIGIEGFLNPNDTKTYDKECHLEPWTKWHNSIPAEIMVVGQDLEI